MWDYVQRQCLIETSVMQSAGKASFDFYNTGLSSQMNRLFVRINLDIFNYYRKTQLVALQVFMNMLLIQKKPSRMMRHLQTYTAQIDDGSMKSNWTCLLFGNFSLSTSVETDFIANKCFFWQIHFCHQLEFFQIIAGKTWTCKPENFTIKPKYTYTHTCRIDSDSIARFMFQGFFPPPLSRKDVTFWYTYAAMHTCDQHCPWTCVLDNSCEKQQVPTGKGGKDNSRALHLFISKLLLHTAGFNSEYPQNEFGQHQSFFSY